jgi:hypothetical protein
MTLQFVTLLIIFSLIAGTLSPKPWRQKFRGVKFRDTTDTITKGHEECVIKEREGSQGAWIRYGSTRVRVIHIVVMRKLGMTRRGHREKSSENVIPYSMINKYYKLVMQYCKKT